MTPLNAQGNFFVKKSPRLDPHQSKQNGPEPSLLDCNVIQSKSVQFCRILFPQQSGIPYWERIPYMAPFLDHHIPVYVLNI
jgi:hypothetical protein